MAPFYQIKPPEARASTPQPTCLRTWRRVRAPRQQTQLDRGDSQE